ncbi:MucR family transcriptional regulator [Sphingomonas sp. M1-B02]|uniref:MucR family transcriptional regulator n=1 Tax=Sphingomonas sp. M1-B02 TaxID=3114300 RepID=UPI00223EEE00|nr:MucR family transcriptional regulator [Sphingomonas sp. S6-11]UZK67707.1 MucR family transcriptional regulator [Sphingomonas sp. S6-11]
MPKSEDHISTVELATELTIAWLRNPNTRASTDDVPAFLAKMHESVGALGSTAPAPAVEETGQRNFAPAVSVRKSLASRDFIISLLDGKPYKMLTRHLSTHGLTPAGYRARFGLKADYPMTAPAYSERRRELAKKAGLGRKPSQKRGRAITKV